MIRILVIAVCAIGAFVWNVSTEPDGVAPFATGASDRQNFDLEGGQEMRPRLRKSEGGADGTSGN